MHNLFSGVDSMLAVTQSQFSASGVTFGPKGDKSPGDQMSYTRRAVGVDIVLAGAPQTP